MIGFLRGRVIAKDAHTIHLLCGDVGYEMTLTGNLLTRTRIGQDAEIFIHTHVREDDLALYGFATATERQIFRRLIAVSGVGPKLALSILAVFSVEQLVDCVRRRDIELFTRVPGVGPKKAEKLLIELKSKLEVEGADALPAAAFAPALGMEEDLIAALSQLGYKPAEFSPTVARLRQHFGDRWTTMSVSDVLSLVLRQLSQSGFRQAPHGGER